MEFREKDRTEIELYLSYTKSTALKPLRKLVMLEENNKQTTKTETTQHFVAFGINQTEEISATEICGGADKVARVGTHTSFLNDLLSGLMY